MKVKLNTGEIVECTVQEFLELKDSGLLGAPKISKEEIPRKEKVVVVDNAVKGARHYSTEEIDIIKEHYKKGYTFLKKMLSGRTKKSVMMKVLRLQDEGVIEKIRMPIVNRKRKKEPIRKHKSPEKEIDGRVKRMRFINQRAIHYCHSLGWAFEKARFKAIEDYNNKAPAFNKSSPVVQKKNKGIIKDSDLIFPAVFPVPEENTPKVEQVVLNMMNTTKRLNYFDMKWIPLGDDKEWNGRLWVEFVTQFMLNSTKIAKALNIPNGFRRTRVRGFDVIEYR